MARRFHQIADSILAEALADIDAELTLHEFFVLGTLMREPELDQASLALRIGVDRSNIGLIVDDLEARGLVERRINPLDRRARQLSVTTKGTKLRSGLMPATQRSFQKIMAPLTEGERETFLDLLERLIAANEPYSEPGAGRRKRAR